MPEQMWMQLDPRSLPNRAGDLLAQGSDMLGLAAAAWEQPEIGAGHQPRSRTAISSPTTAG
jgi:hypothetical protein